MADPARRVRRWPALLVALLLLALTGSPAPAHFTPNSELRLDFASDHVLIDAIIPEGDYYLAAGAPSVRDVAAARRWLAQQVSATAPDGRAWHVAIDDLEFAQIAGPPDLHASIRLTPPRGAPVRRFTLRWSAVIAQNPDHFALIVVGRDYGRGVLPEDRKLIGALRGDTQTIAIDRGAPSQLAAFQAAFRLGMKHIAEGTDHLLFLLSLLLPAPLIAAGRRWGLPRAPRAAMLTLAKIITAFTLGHSLTLLLSAMGGWTLPTAPVEIAIALSILVSAIHAIRPWFAGKEPWVAAGFGLIHGLAFATLVGQVGLVGDDRLLAILGFNLGIEAVQLLVAGAAIVPLMLIAPTPDYRFVRLGGALFAGIAACAWLVERVSGMPNPIAGLIQSLAGQAPWLLAALAAYAAAIRLRPSPAIASIAES